MKEDIGESNNLADKYPQKVNELDKLIDEFLEETEAAVPEPNPDYNPDATEN